MNRTNTVNLRLAARLSWKTDHWFLYIHNFFSLKPSYCFTYVNRICLPEKLFAWDFQHLENHPGIIIIIIFHRATYSLTCQPTQMSFFFSYELQSIQNPISLIKQYSLKSNLLEGVSQSSRAHNSWSGSDFPLRFIVSLNTFSLQWSSDSTSSLLLFPTYFGN